MLGIDAALDYGHTEALALADRLAKPAAGAGPDRALDAH